MTVSMTVPFVLPSDVLLIPVPELSAQQRGQIDAPDTSFAISRPRSRRPSSILDGASAALVERFRTPRTIADAVIAFSADRATAPHAVLKGALPVLLRLINAGLLVPQEDAAAHVIVASHDPGDEVAGCTIVRLLRLVTDVESYHVQCPDGSPGVLKLARGASSGGQQQTYTRERDLLRRASAAPVIRLLDAGEAAGQPYLLTALVAGVPPSQVAREFRELGPDGDPLLLGLARQVTGAYARLHGCGVSHGDVHDGNILIDRDGQATLLDLGLARALDDPSAPGGRAAVWGYFDPELAEALLAGRTTPAATELSDQYALGALLFRLFTGEPHLALKLHRQVALTQVVEERARQFESTGAAAWPALEAVLRRMLAPRAEERFACMSDVLAALDALPVANRDTGVRRPVAARIARFADDLFARLTVDRALYRDGIPLAPTGSVNNGAAGIAVAWYRRALAEDSASHLLTAGAWARRALAWNAHAEAWWTNDHVFTPAVMGRSSVYHSVTGAHVARALVASAAGDMHTLRTEAGAFVDAASARSSHRDLTLGDAGVLLACAHLTESSPNELPSLRAFGDRIDRAMARRRARSGALREGAAPRPLAMAHGEIGLLYATLRWGLAIGAAPAATVADRLEELSTLALVGGRGISWPRSSHGEAPDGSPSWCNGETGFLFFWLLAAEATGNARFLALAERTAWTVWDGKSGSLNNLCCGRAGRAYALLALYRATGEEVWRRRARALAERAAAGSDVDAADAHRLWKGSLGIALLLTDLERPERARLPLFEREGWKWTRSVTG